MATAPSAGAESGERAPRNRPIGVDLGPRPALRHVLLAVGAGAGIGEHELAIRELPFVHQQVAAIGHPRLVPDATLRVVDRVALTLRTLGIRPVLLDHTAAEDGDDLVGPGLLAVGCGDVPVPDPEVELMMRHIVALPGRSGGWRGCGALR
jgi:hypothetical protein